MNTMNILLIAICLMASDLTKAQYVSRSRYANRYTNPCDNGLVRAYNCDYTSEDMLLYRLNKLSAEYCRTLHQYYQASLNTPDAFSYCHRIKQACSAIRIRTNRFDTIKNDINKDYDNEVKSVNPCGNGLVRTYYNANCDYTRANKLIIRLNRLSAEYCRVLHQYYQTSLVTSDEFSYCHRIEQACSTMRIRTNPIAAVTNNNNVNYDDEMMIGIDNPDYFTETMDNGNGFIQENNFFVINSKPETPTTTTTTTTTTTPKPTTRPPPERIISTTLPPKTTVTPREEATTSTTTTTTTTPKPTTRPPPERIISTTLPPKTTVTPCEAATTSTTTTTTTTTTLQPVQTPCAMKQTMAPLAAPAIDDNDTETVTCLTATLCNRQFENLDLRESNDIKEFFHYLLSLFMSKKLPSPVE